ncbi:uncharacterized protein LOC125473405 [Pyrus x bretschneideri]|uniref:uncharacterized protein LOC125473405 n=1 Tax=Pyrus x bretschneideri TaxID=225117 RepID=UPI00202E8ACD|nr:uncharacterized protein LOC125473405 [Pyrus x bretschneideri]
MTEYDEKDVESRARVASITLPTRNPNPNTPPASASPKPSNKCRATLWEKPNWRRLKQTGRLPILNLLINSVDCDITSSCQVLYDKKPAGHTHAPTPAHKSEENGRPIPQPQTYQPAQSTRDEYLHRFKKNAALVASGVARNVNRVGNYVKQSADDILYPYRRRPK